MNVGKLFSVSFYPSSPWLLGAGGSGNSLALWDLSGEEAIRKRFADRIQGSVFIEGNKEIEGDIEKKEQDFEAMMSSGDAMMEKTRQNASLSKGKNKKKKKKVHKRRG